jgi:peptidoglycan/LPS O-acetylase OafA/YrhL
MGWILLLRKIKDGGLFYEHVLLPVSKASYGMYLCHMLLLASVSAWLRTSLGLGADGVLGIWTTPVQILATAGLSFAGVALFCVLVRRIPKAGKWIIG